jgi:hypothetical protein
VLVVADCGAHNRAPVNDRRLGRWEVLGAWLGLWTPPRGVVVPPPPWRRIAVGAAVLLAVAVALTVVALPRVGPQTVAMQERAAARHHAAFLESVDRQQRPRRGRGRPDPRGAAPAERVRTRAALLVTARSRIASDARGRSPRRVRGVDCERFPRTLGTSPPAHDLALAWATYDCVAVTSRLVGGQGIIGMPFRLLLDFTRVRFAWCRIVPLGDQDRLEHPLPPACRRP